MNYSSLSKEQLIDEIQRLKASLLALKKEQNTPAADRSPSGEKKYQEMVESLPQIIFEADTDGKLTYANRFAFQNFGYSKTEFNKGIYISDILTPEDAGQSAKNMRDLLNGKDIGQPEYRARRKDGSTFHLKIYSNAIIKNGEAVGLRGIAIDITEIKRAQTIQKTLYEISNALSTTTKMHELYSKIRDNLSQIIDTRNFFVALYDEKKDMIRLPFMSDEKDSFSSFPAGKSLSAYVLKTGKALLATNDQIKKLIKKGIVEIVGTPAKIWLGVPLKLEQKVIGLIGMQSYDDPHHYNEEDVELLTFVSEGIAIAIKHKQASEAIRQSEERYRKLFDSSKDAIMTLAPPDWKFTSGNPTILEMFQVKDIDEFTSLGPWELSPQLQADGRPSAEKAKEMIRTAMDQGSNYFEWLHQRRDGEVFPCTVLLTRVDLADSVFLQATVRDITQEKKALDALRKSEARFRRLFEDLGDAVFVTQIGGANRGAILEVNPAAERQTGYSRDELITMNIEKDISVQDSEELSYNEWDKKLTNNEVVTSIEKKRKKDGSEYWTEVVVTPIEYKGKKAGLSINHDITERKLLEAQLRQSQKMEAVGQLAGGVAHDFNNLLTVINGYCDLLAMRDLPPEIANPVAQIHNAGKRAARLTSQLLAFSRKQIIQPKLLNLNSLISDYMKMLGRLLGENIEIDTKLQSDLELIKADPGQIEQIIMNIAINASDAMPFGGRLTIETANTVFNRQDIKNLPGARAGRFVMLSISDTGVGMDKATQNHIFEPFFTTKGRDKGTGLGLATVYGIIKQNNGFIYVESALQKGSSFRVYLPCVKTRQSESPENERNNNKLMGTETILLVEDEEEVREVAKSTLAQYGYAVICASNGTEAVRIYKKNRSAIDLLLTDVVMPQMNGPQLAREIKKSDPQIKVLYFSGYTDSHISRHGVLNEDAEFIQKPFSHIELAKKLRKVLDGK